MAPMNYEHAKRLNNVNKNTNWQDSTNLEMSQLDEYDTFISHCYGKTAPQGYKKVRTHHMVDIKYDGRNKARCVIDAHLLDIPIESVY